ncbi:MAG: rhodanese-like domain-containing protein [Pseudomonadota bacterium]
MSTRRSNYLALLTAAIFLMTGLFTAQGQDNASPAPIVTTERAINFDGFLAFSERTMAYRADRLISLDDFLTFAGEYDTIILDTRSASAFAEGHIDGAVHLNFSDFTERKLADIVPDRATRILIYCNNNFIEDAEPVPAKSPQLALNIPTFVNLFGYGYLNVYELGEMVSLDDPRLTWVTSEDMRAPITAQTAAP